MADFNRVILMGRLTRDPELRYIPSGTAVAEFGLAVNDRRKNNQTGEWVEDTQFIDITLWARQAEIASEYLSKGSSVFIEGRLKYDTWEKEGQKHSKLRVVGEKMQFIGGRGDGGGSRSGGESEFAESAPGTPAASSAQQVPAGQAPKDDLPF
jgi:single-strand DNA-binding protein